MRNLMMLIAVVATTSSQPVLANWQALQGKTFVVRFELTEVEDVSNDGTLVEDYRRTETHTCFESYHFYFSQQGRMFWSRTERTCGTQYDDATTSEIGSVFDLTKASGTTKTGVVYKVKATDDGIILTTGTKFSSTWGKARTSSRYEWITRFGAAGPCDVERSGTGRFETRSDLGRGAYDHHVRRLTRTYRVAACEVAQGKA